MVPGWFFMVSGWFFLAPGRFSWFFMVFHGSRLVFHGYRPVFMFFMVPDWFFMVFLQNVSAQTVSWSDDPVCLNNRFASNYNAIMLQFCKVRFEFPIEMLSQVTNSHAFLFSLLSVFPSRAAFYLTFKRTSIFHFSCPVQLNR